MPKNDSSDFEACRKETNIVTIGENNKELLDIWNGKISIFYEKNMIFHFFI